MLIAFSLNHRRATVAEREPFVLPAAECVRLGRLARRACAGEMVLLMTCNRVELFAWAAATDPQSAMACIRQVGLRIAPDLADRFLNRAEQYVGSSAAEHLLRVAAGLESQVEGDAQVLGQVRTAYARSAGCGSVGAELHRLFQTALRTGKRVRAETGFGHRDASVGAEAALWWLGGTTTRQHDAMMGRRVVVVGAGKTAEHAARVLVRGGASVTIINRTPEAAAVLALRLGASWAPFEERHEMIAQADAAIVATAAAQPTVRQAELEAARLRGDRVDRPLSILDLSVPRNVDPEVATLPAVTLTGLEDVSSTQERIASVSRRAAERIVAEELAGLVAWMAYRTDRRKSVA